MTEDPSLSGLLEASLHELESSYVYPHWVADASVELDEVVTYVLEVFPALRHCPPDPLREALHRQVDRIRELVS